MSTKVRFPTGIAIGFVACAAAGAIVSGAGATGPADKRGPAPAEEYLAREIEVVRTSFQAEYAAAEAQGDWRPLINTLSQRANVSDSGSRRYALLTEAERLAVENNLFSTALGLAEERTLRFQSPTWSVRLTLLERMKESPAVEHVEAGIELAESSFNAALNGGDFDVANAFLQRLGILVAEYGKREREWSLSPRSSAAAATPRRTPPRVRKPERESGKGEGSSLHRRKGEYEARLAACGRELADARRRQATWQTHAASQLGTPEATEAGRYLCLDRFDWEAGLGYLERAGGSLAETARRERLARREERPALLAAAADEWWRLAEDASRQADANPSDVGSLETHAADLYVSALQALEGLERQVVRGRVQSARPPRILRGVERSAADCESAPDVVLVYKTYLAQPQLTDAERRAAAARMRCWQTRAEDQFVNNGGRWLTRRESEEIAGRAVKRLDHGLELLRLGQFELAKGEFDEASKIDPSSPTADFVIAYICTAVAENDGLAAEHFREGVRRRPRDGALLANLANTELAVGRHADALVHYGMALDRMADPLIVNNVGFALQVGGQAGMSDAVQAGFSQLYRRALSELGLERKTVDGLTFFRPPANLDIRLNPPGTTARRNPALDKEATVSRVATGTGFVVAPGVVVTNRRIVEGSSEIVVVDSGSRRRRVAATVMASSSTPDLAILQCRDLPGDPLRLAGELVPPGEDVMALGFPELSLLDMALKSNRGTVVAAVDADRAGTFLHDCAVTTGDSGGPIVDRFGRLVGVTLAPAPVRDEACRSGMGIPVQAVLGFLDRTLPPEVKPLPPMSAPAGAGKSSWSDVDARTSRSTVFILAKTFVRGRAVAGDPAGPGGRP